MQIAALKPGRQVFLVGGAIRDVLLGREPEDFDFAVSGSGLEFARNLARRLRTKLVVLSEKDDEARVVWQGRTIDFNGFGAKTIVDDLGRRDFTINAMACELTPSGLADILDPCSGRRDLAVRLIRPVSDLSLASDPLRLLRAYRLALELGLEVHRSVDEQGSRISLARIAAERVGVEMLRIMEAPGSFPFVMRLYQLGRLAEVLPGLAPLLADDRLREHTFRTYCKLEELVSKESFFSRFEPEWQEYFDRWPAGESQGRKSEIGGQNAVDAQQNTAIKESAKPGLPYRRAMLKLCGLLHDIAKPETRFTNSDGEIHFYGHDTLGSRLAGKMARERLRLSRAQIKMVETHVQEHMRLHLLATNPELTDRAIRRFFRDLGSEAFGVMMLCYADGWATAGHTNHLEDTITRMIEQKRTEDAKLRVRRYVTGHDLIALGLKPGPVFKVILRELEDLQLEGRINSHEEGLEYLKLNLPGLAAKAGAGQQTGTNE